MAVVDLWVCNAGDNCGTSPDESKLTKLPKAASGGIITDLYTAKDGYLARSDFSNTAWFLSMEKKGSTGFVRVDLLNADTGSTNTYYLKDKTISRTSDIPGAVKNKELDWGTKIVQKTRTSEPTYAKKGTLKGHGIYECTNAGGSENYYVVE